jgi:AcrR family transcriptional regulator
MAPQPKKKQTVTLSARQQSPRADSSLNFETRRAILDAAEALFTERGYAKTSLRELTRIAGVNIAAVNYHFGSKDALLMEVFRRAGISLNRERLLMLEAIEIDRDNLAATVHQILFALLAPAVRWAREPGNQRLYVKFLARARQDGPPEMKSLIETEVAHLQPFALALGRTLTHLSQAQIYWSLHFILGMEHAVHLELKRIESMSGGICKTDDADDIIKQIIDFSLYGLLDQNRTPTKKAKKARSSRR